MLLNTDYTMVVKVSENDFSFFEIYPNPDGPLEEDEDEVVVTKAHHRYNPCECGSIRNFSNYVEDRYYIEYYHTVNDFLNTFENVKWFISEEELQKNLKSLKVGDTAVAVYNKAEFVVSMLNNWLDGELYPILKDNYDFSRDEIVEHIGFLYSKEDDDYIQILDEDNILDVPVSVSEIFPKIIEAEVSNSDLLKLSLVKMLWKKTLN